MLHGRHIYLHENRLTGPDGTFAGAHLTMIEAVRNALGLLEVPLADALVMASRTPAAISRVWTPSLAVIAPGYRADLVAFNTNFEVVGTWIGGVGSMGEASEVLKRFQAKWIPVRAKKTRQTRRRAPFRFIWNGKGSCTEVRCETIPSSCKTTAVPVSRHRPKFAASPKISPICTAAVIASWPIVSAMGKTTDQLIAMACQVSPHPNRRELDMLPMADLQRAATSTSAFA